MTNHLNKKIEWIDEYLDGTRLGLECIVLANKRSKYQEIKIINSKKHGKGMLLDNCWMTTELDEKYYHECLVHPALCSANKIDKVLIIGGGDGGSARECLLYKEVGLIDLVEIDSEVISLSKKYMPEIGGSAWKDPRLNIKIEDGINWVNNAQKDSYDVIIVDSSDPKGPAKGLFNETFFTNCKRILRAGGVFATQSESPEAFRKIHVDTVKILRKVFKNADPLYGCVPMYPSGIWSWTFASIDKKRYLHPISNRANEVSNFCKIWSPKWQKGSFEAIPAFIEQALKNDSD